MKRIAKIETEKIETLGDCNLPIRHWKGDLSSLRTCWKMFDSEIETFEGDLSNLVEMDEMFGDRHNLRKFDWKPKNVENPTSVITYLSWRSAGRIPNPKVVKSLMEFMYLSESTVHADITLGHGEWRAVVEFLKIYHLFYGEDVSYEDVYPEAMEIY